MTPSMDWSSDEAMPSWSCRLSKLPEQGWSEDQAINTQASGEHVWTVTPGQFSSAVLEVIVFGISAGVKDNFFLNATTWGQI